LRWGGQGYVFELSHQPAAFIGRHFTADNDRFMDLFCQFIGSRYRGRTLRLPLAPSRNVPAQRQTAASGLYHRRQPLTVF
jgi:hypothetical protein